MLIVHNPLICYSYFLLFQTLGLNKKIIRESQKKVREFI